jgi:hypothetical protein
MKGAWMNDIGKDLGGKPGTGADRRRRSSAVGRFDFDYTALANSIRRLVADWEVLTRFSPTFESSTG